MLAARAVEYVQSLKRRLSDTERATAEQTRLAQKARTAQEDAERRNDELRTELEAVRAEAKASQELVAYHVEIANATLAAIKGGLPNCGPALSVQTAKTPPPMFPMLAFEEFLCSDDEELISNLPDMSNEQPRAPEKDLRELIDEDLEPLDGACIHDIKEPFYKDNPSNRRQGNAGMLRPRIRECAASSDCKRCRDLVAIKTSDAPRQLFA